MHLQMNLQMNLVMTRSLTRIVTEDTKNIFFELFIYLCWLAPLQFQPKSHPTQEAARSTTFETPLSALLKIIYPESWD